VMTVVPSGSGSMLNWTMFRKFVSSSETRCTKNGDDERSDYETRTGIKR
jgi:hypothetical protein